MEIGTLKNTPTFLSSGSRSYPAPDKLANSEAMASSSQISEMVPDKLGEWLLGEFGSDYHEDIDVFVGKCLLVPTSSPALSHAHTLLTWQVQGSMDKYFWD